MRCGSAIPRSCATAKAACATCNWQAGRIVRLRAAFRKQAERRCRRVRRRPRVRDVVTKALEDLRGAKVINKSQEATVSFTAPQATLDALSAFDASVFEELFIVSGVTFAAGDELACEVKPAEGDKCPRCWNYRESSAATPTTPMYASVAATPLTPSASPRSKRFDPA